MAYISASLSMSFANPLAFLTLLPHSISQFFSGKDPSLAMRSPFFFQGSRIVAMVFAVWLCVRMGGGRVQAWGELSVFGRASFKGKGFRDWDPLQVTDTALFIMCCTLENTL